ncbi:MAG: alpha/beta fold hydrolase [bacterium]
MWIGAALGTGIFVFIWGWFSAGLVLKIPRLKLESSPQDYGLEYEKHSLISSDNIKIHAWFVPCQGSNATIILLHGWGAHKGNILPNSFFLHNRGKYNLLYIDYRNHGESGGTSSSLGLHETKDLIAAVEFLKAQKPHASVHIGLLGVSLGATIGILGTAQIPEIEALVAESAFGRPADVIVRYAKLFYNVPKFPLVLITLLFVQLKLKIRFAQIEALQYIGRIAPRPVFLIQGAEDVRMPPSEGKNLFARAGNPKHLWTVPGADHAEAYAKSSVEYEKKLLEFFSRHLKI